jgi:putative transposase
LDEFKSGEHHVCELMEVPRLSCRYRSRCDDSQLREQLQALAREHPRFGYRRLHVLLGREQIRVNHKKVQRVYRELGLMVKRNRRKRLQSELRLRPVLTAPSQEWSIDFASDVTASGRRLRVLNALDSFTKQSMVLESV